MATDTVPGIQSDPKLLGPGSVASSAVSVDLSTGVPSGNRSRRAAIPVRRTWLLQREGSFWDRGRILEFPPKLTEGTLGRSSSCHWRINDSSVSRLHAALVRRPRRGTYLLDLASREGTFLNGERVTGEVLLMDGDRIGIGSRVVLEFIDHPKPPEGGDRRWWRPVFWGFGVLAAVGIVSLIVF
jgi:hypothetical protein